MRCVPCTLTFLIASLTAVHSAVASPEPGITIYHVGYDDAEFVGFGQYAGLENPNYQRLVFLLSHTFVDNATSNHFHRIGAYSYTGDPLNPDPGFSTNDRVPEPYQMDDGLSLLRGEGPFDGKLISGLGPESRPDDEIEQEYGDLLIAPIDELFEFDGAADPDGEYDYHPGHFLLNASSGAYKQSIADVTVGLKLVGISPGLTIHDQEANLLMDSVDDMLTLGPGVDWTLDPVFAVDADVDRGSTYEA
ncbi:MAG: all3515 family Zur-repressed PEP-CTERM protein, partial [Planctomycetota bacterium]